MVPACDHHPVLAIPGSLRTGSFNRAALVAAAELAPDGMAIEIARTRRHPVLQRRRRAGDRVPAGRGIAPRSASPAADALLLATPEYNASTTGVLKNALDWLSRGGPDSALRNKPTAILGAGGRFGSLRAQLHLREILTNSGSDLVGFAPGDDRCGADPLRRRPRDSPRSATATRSPDLLQALADKVACPTAEAPAAG